MKKFGLIAIAILFAATLCACSNKEEAVPTTPQTNTQPAATVPATIPEMDPTLDTNIPDPTVNENSQGMGTEDNTNGINDSNGSTTGTENSDIGTDNNQNGLDNSARSRMFRK